MWIMLPQFYLSTILVFSTVAIAAPGPVIVSKSPVSLALSRHVNTTSIHNLARHDKMRAKRFKSQPSNSKSGSFPSRKAAAAPTNATAYNQAVIYVAKIQVGTSPTSFSVIIDTGSSNTWVGADTAKCSLKTSKSNENLVEVQYGSGEFVGMQVTDIVTLGPELSIVDQSIGCSIWATGFDGVDGILGLGPTALTVGTMAPSNGEEIPTVVDNSFSQGLIPAREVGIYFEPTNLYHGGQGVPNGVLTFGGIDSSKNTSIFTYTPVTKTEPAGYYWGIDQSIKYGNTTLLSSGSPGIVDTGTTLILIASDAFDNYANITGATSDKATGLLRLSLPEYRNMLDMIFIIEGTEFRLIPDAQIWPRALNVDIGGTTDIVYLIIGDIGTKSGSRLDFVNGFAFLERFYSVFDTTYQRVGFATTAITRNIINGIVD